MIVALTSILRKLPLFRSIFDQPKNISYPARQALRQGAAFRDLYTLVCKALKGSAIPRRLYALKGEHKFICEDSENSHSCFNVFSPAGKMLIVFAKDDVVARQLSKTLFERYLSDSMNGKW